MALSPSCVVFALGRCWGLGSWIYILVDSAASLSKKGRQLFSTDHLSKPIEWACLVVNILFFALIACTVMVRWSGVLVRRAFSLDAGCPWRHHVLAPLFVAGFYAATPKRILKAWGLVLFIVVIGIVVAHLPSPYRAIVDVGVVLNLLGGTLALIGFTAQVLFLGRLPELSPDFPDGGPTYPPVVAFPSGDAGLTDVAA